MYYQRINTDQNSDTVDPEENGCGFWNKDNNYFITKVPLSSAVILNKSAGNLHHLRPQLPI